MDRTEAAVLFRTYSKKLYNIALRITASAPESEGIMQETLIRYLTKAPRLESEAQKSAWLRRTCVRLSIDWLRKKRRLLPLDETAENIPDEETLQAEKDSPVWEQLGPDALKDVMEAICSLPDGYRTVLILKLVEGYDNAMVAKELNISESGVRSQFLRAKKKVADMIRRKIEK